jgi:hypothetical protein
VVTRADPLGGQVVGKAVRLVFELGVRNLAVAEDQRDPIREGVDGMLEQVGQVQCHG